MKVKYTSIQNLLYAYLFLRCVGESGRVVHQFWYFHHQFWFLGVFAKYLIAGPIISFFPPQLVFRKSYTTKQVLRAQSASTSPQLNDGPPFRARQALCLVFGFQLDSLHLKPCVGAPATPAASKWFLFCHGPQPRYLLGRSLVRGWNTTPCRF